MNLTASNTLIVALGGVGYQMADKFAQEVARRHPDVPLPTVRILPLLEEAQQMAEARKLAALGVAIRPNSPDLRAIFQHLYPHTPLPESSSEMARLLQANARPRGQVALHRHIFEITNALQEARRAMFSSASLDVMSQHGVSVANARRVQVFVLLSLSDGFMSGLLPDLPYIIQHTLTEAAPEDTFVNINLVLAMPGFRGEVRDISRHDLDGEQVRDVAQARRIAQTQIQAGAAATLREVDYYLANDHRFESRYSRYLKIEASNHPLGEGRIFLLEPTNEQEKSLDDVNTLSSMVAEWLYHVTLTPLREVFETPVLLPVGRPYSSFGHASLSVPVERWIERLTVRQEIDLLTHMLDAQQVAERVDVATTRTQLHLTESELRDVLIEKTMFNDLRMQSLAFRNVPLAAGESFLQRVQDRYTEMMTTQLPETRGDMHYRKRQLTSKNSEIDHNLVDELERYVLQLLDDPNGGIIKAHLFLEALRDDLRQDRDNLREGYMGKRKSAEKQQKKIMRSRENYLGRAAVAEGIGSIPFVWLGAMLLLGALPVMALLLTWLNTGVGVINWAGLVVLIGLTGVIFGRTFNTLRTTRYRVVKNYDERLQAFRDTDLQEAMIQLYDDLIQWIGNFRQGVNHVWEQLTDIRTGLNTEWEVRNDVRQLSGVARDRLAEYLLTTEGIEQTERELPLNDFSETGEALRQAIGTPSAWIQKNTTQEALAEKLHRFARERVARALMYYDLRTAIKNVPADELNGKFQRVYQLSFPYWRHDPTKVSLIESAEINSAVAPDLNLDLARLFGANVSQVAMDNRYEIVLNGVRHGFGLHEMNAYTQMLARGYQEAIFSTRELLHTTADRLALPDPQVTPAADWSMQQLPLRQLYGVARALGVLMLGTTGGQTGIEVSWTGQDGRVLMVGATPAEAIFRLEYDRVLAEAIRGEIGRKWRNRGALDSVREWVQTVDVTNPEYWARLAAEDFVDAVDESALFV
jgi:hypothetical protein